MTTPAPRWKAPAPFNAPVSLRANVASFMALDVMVRARRREQEGHDIVHLEIGEPASPPPRAVREAAIAALDGRPIGYTEALGRPSLRVRIARHYRDAYGVEVAPERVAVTTGSSGGFVLAFLALFDAGARVAVAAPGYPAYRNILEALGIETVTIEAPEDTRFVVTAAMVEAAHAEKKLDGLLLMSPANPTGAMMSGDALRDICATCERLGIAFISDEVYHGLTYGEPAQTALQYSSQAVVANSFSKYFCMTGWRIGWLVLPDHLVRPVERLHQSLAISAPYLSQLGAEAVFEAQAELDAALARYASNRAILLNELPGMGLDRFHPADGAFYLYVDISRFSGDSLDFCGKMLNEIGVAATPGLDFDRTRGHHAVRFSFAGSERDVVEASRRMKSWLR
ncbi:aminotransferase class I/II-fold pyridoxal phosphate-dependent enzyme [Methylocapsa polymorpha]|uniref:aspartate transaminase n=1 Tax=Methylocapsa polymorpha TaxID=3080828 RepID=A0ABZ0HRY2_9HYPH|nr:aminotransferase class I/II-fold pyridoxal phosphate-dependent enzyme [Methylocapsa sp. RX1]